MAARSIVRTREISTLKAQTLSGSSRSSWKAEEQIDAIAAISAESILTRRQFIETWYQQVRRNGNFYKYLKLEQETERAHHVLNQLEARFECIKNKAMKYFLMWKAFKNIQKTDFSLVKTKHPYKK